MLDTEYMRRFLPVLFCVFTLILISLIWSTVSFAGELTNVSVRLDRTKANTATGGLICAQTPSASNGSEARVSVAFPAAFTLNSNASNWTVDTNNLPQGANAWPGIGTAISVANKTVTFPSANLSTSTLYCFNFSATNTLTTGSSGTDQYGNVATRTNAGNTIDSKYFGLSITSNDQISVGATVPANPTDFSAVISADQSGTLSQNTVITYTITYGSSLSNATNITLEAEWTLGTIVGQGAPSVELLNYVSGSATNAYGSSPPVIDTVNRKITWTISPFPANTSGQTVTFQLKTSGVYTGDIDVSAQIAARLLGPGTQTADSISYLSYNYDNGSNSNSGAGSSSGSGSATGSPTSPAPTSIPQPTSLQFQNINVESISEDSATIYVTTNFASNIEILYGKEINNLSSSIKDSNSSTSHLVTINKLSPDTVYYFKINATSESGNITSDIYTFNTAKVSEAVFVEPNSIIITASNNILLSPSSTNQDGIISNILSIPISSIFEFQIATSGKKSVKKIQAFIKNESVLGINTFGNIDAADNTLMTEVSRGLYFGRLATPLKAGKYGVYAKVFDINGNITQHKVATLIVVDKFQVVNTEGQPIEWARVFIKRYNLLTKIYEDLPTSFSIKNPTYTNALGQINYVLPQGKYRATVSSLTFQPKTVDFSIGTSFEDKYPKVVLESSGFNLVTSASYFLSLFSDNISAFITFTFDLTQSVRFFFFNSTIIIFIFILLTLLSFISRTHINPLHIHRFIAHKIDKNSYLTGIILDEKGTLLSRSEVFAVNHSGLVLASANTNKAGHFILPAESTISAIRVLKPGFKTTEINVNSDSQQYSITLHKTTPIIRSVFGEITKLTEWLLGLCFEILLITSLVLELIFIPSLGLQVIPFLTLSLLNLILWGLFIKSKH